MPDLPLDTLIVVGLVIASLIGRIFQKKEAPEASPQESSAERSSTSEETSLEDILSETWSEEEVLEQVPFTEELPALAEESPPAVVPAVIEMSSAQEAVSVLIENQPVKAQKAKWIGHELLSTRGALKKAFVLKEVLDKPVSLRSRS